MFTTKNKKDLKQLLSIAAKKENFSSLDGLHGFLFGLAIIPETFLPDEWITEIFDVRILETHGQEEVSRLMKSVSNVYSKMYDKNRNGDLRFPFDYDVPVQKDLLHMRDWAKGLFLATKLCPTIWGIRDGDGYDDQESDSGELSNLGELDGHYDYMLADFYEEEAAMSRGFAVIKGVAYPERIPEIFHKAANGPNALVWHDPNLEAKLFEMLEDAVETLRVYAELYEDDFDDY